MEEFSQPQAHQRFLDIPWRIKDVFLGFIWIHLVVFGLLILSGIVLTILQQMGLVGEIDKETLTRPFFVTTLLAVYYLIFALVTKFYLLDRAKGRISRLFIIKENMKSDVLYGLKIFIFSLLFIILSTFLVIFILVMVGIFTGATERVASGIETYFKGAATETQKASVLGLSWVGIILMLVAAPMVEEVFYRGCLYGSLRNRFSMLPSMALSSLVFALIHGYAFNFFQVLIIGLFCAHIYERRRSLVAPIFFHFLWNLRFALFLFK